MKKKITAIFLCVALVAIAVVGASLAYFTDTKTAENTFTMGNVKITLDETDVNNPEGDRVTSNAYEVYPGAVVTKDPIVHNVGNNGAYIRATVNVSNWMNLVAAYYPDFKETFPNDGYKAALNLLVGELGEGWSVVAVVAGDVEHIGEHIQQQNGDAQQNSDDQSDGRAAAAFRALDSMGHGDSFLVSRIQLLLSG